MLDASIIICLIILLQGAFATSGVKIFDINNKIVEELSNYGPVADVEYSISSSDIKHLTVKIWLQININKKDSSKAMLTVVRLDNVDERPNERLDNIYNIKHMDDTVWRNWRGWPVELMIELKEGSKSLRIPENPDYDTLQIELQETSFIPVVENTKKEQIIPRIIHQIGADFKNQPLMKVVQKANLLTRLKNPSWSHRVLSMEEMPDLIEQLEGPTVRRAFETLKPMAFKADLYRYVVLYHYGGIYMDSKLVPIESFDSLSKNAKHLITKGKNKNDYIQIAFLGTQTRNPLLRAAIDKVVENVEAKFYGKDPLSITGPAMFGNLLKSMRTPRQNSPFEQKLIFSKNALFINSLETGKPKIIYHVGEYRRMQKFNDVPVYDALWRERNVYGEKDV